jgi:primosomal protein N'
MRKMKPHVQKDGYVDYYECSKCGWAYPCPRFVSKADSGLTNQQRARIEFNVHLCKPVTQAARIKGF